MIFVLESNEKSSLFRAHSFRSVSSKSNAVVGLSKSLTSTCDTCLFLMCTWAFERKDYYRDLFTDAEALSLSRIPRLGCAVNFTRRTHPFITLVISSGSRGRAALCTTNSKFLSQFVLIIAVVLFRNHPASRAYHVDYWGSRGSRLLEYGNGAYSGNILLYDLVVENIIVDLAKPEVTQRRSGRSIEILFVCVYLFIRYTMHTCVFRNCTDVNKCDYTESGEIAPLFALRISIRACTILFLSALCSRISNKQSCATKENNSYPEFSITEHLESSWRI